MLGKQSLSEISVKYKVTIRTLNNWFTPFWSKEPIPKQANFFRPFDQVEERLLSEKYDFNNESYILRLTLDAKNASEVAYRLSIIGS